LPSTPAKRGSFRTWSIRTSGDDCVDDLPSFMGASVGALVVIAGKGATDDCWPLGPGNVASQPVITSAATIVRAGRWAGKEAVAAGVGPRGQLAAVERAVAVLVAVSQSVGAVSPASMAPSASSFHAFPLTELSSTRSSRRSTARLLRRPTVPRSNVVAGAAD
jgi:hypothetical protein